MQDIIKFKEFNLIDCLCALPSLILRGGVKNPTKITNYIEKVANIENTITMKNIKMPLIIPALDISARKIIYYSSKKLDENYIYYNNRKISEAIRSNIALPILFTPNKVIIENTNHFMLDGGILTNTLISPLRQFSDYVVGITNKFHPKERKELNLFTELNQTFQSMRRSYLSREKQNADLWIEIDTKSSKLFGSLKDIKLFEEIGYETTMKCAEKHYFNEIEEAI